MGEDDVADGPPTAAILGHRYVRHLDAHEDASSTSHFRLCVPALCRFVAAHLTGGQMECCLGRGVTVDPAAASQQVEAHIKSIRAGPRTSPAVPERKPQPPWTSMKKLSHRQRRFTTRALSKASPLPRSKLSSGPRPEPENRLVRQFAHAGTRGLMKPHCKLSRDHHETPAGSRNHA